MIFKTINQQRIFKEIWIKKTSTKKILAQSLDLDKSTITRNVRWFMEKNMLKKIGEIDPGPEGGRKTDVITINENWGYIIGIALEQGEIHGTLLNFRGDSEENKRFIVNITKRNLIKQIIKIVEFFLSKKENVIGISIASPGKVDSEKGKIVFSEALNIENYSLCNEIEKKIGIRCLIENDSNAGAVKFLFDDFSKNNLIYFLLSLPFDLTKPVGLGIGIAINGEIYIGSKFMAGEVPIRVPLFTGTKITLDDFEKSPKKYISKNSNIKSLICHLSDLISTSVNLLDPHIAILGGDISFFPKKYIDEIIKKSKEKVFMPEVRDVEFITDLESLKTIAIGAGRYFIKKLLNDYEFSKSVGFYLEKSFKS